MPTPPTTFMRNDLTDDEMELPVEEVAARLGLPAAMLIRRIEAGDIPARRIDDPEGPHYRVRIADLGTSSRAVMPAKTPAPFAAQTAIDAIDDSDIDLAGTAAAGAPEAHDDEVDEDLAAILPPPPPVRGTVELSPIEAEQAQDPRAELSMMALDPRELVAGLLDRWERTLEQRIYAEQRQRFEAELTNRQAKVKQLQLELDAVRAEHAASLAEKERQLAERERDLARREREIDDLRHQPRRGWLFRR
jgi:hypothetical protein